MSQLLIPEQGELRASVPLSPRWAWTRMTAFIMSQQPVVQAHAMERYENNQFYCAIGDQERWAVKHDIDLEDALLHLMGKATRIAKYGTARELGKQEGQQPSFYRNKVILQPPLVFCELEPIIFESIKEHYISTPTDELSD